MGSDRDGVGAHFSCFLVDDLRRFTLSLDCLDVVARFAPPVTPEEIGEQIESLLSG